MTPDRFVELLEWLTGTPVKELTPSEKKLLGELLGDDERELDCSQFNELLLLANKDKVQTPFFERFFCPTINTTKCKVGQIPAGVERFQQTAMLRFGNFIYAYRTLSRIASKDRFVATLGDLAKTGDQIIAAFRDRSPALLRPIPIRREQTYLTGYLSPREIVAETGRARLLSQLAADVSSWPELEAHVRAALADPSQATELRRLLRLHGLFRSKVGDNAMGEAIRTELEFQLRALATLEDELRSIQAQAETNTDVYLTWDHMDVYFATSMRKRWEFEDLYDFVAELMRCEALADLNLRYFDPTQSFEKNRIDKGLIESLMLKRAKCTVYSVQDTDTLGKDSELAATLAQGKPVIAYAPRIDVESRTERLTQERPLWLRERLRFVLYADESFGDTFSADLDFVETFDQTLEEFENAMAWRSVIGEAELEGFRGKHGAELRRFCRIIAQSEATIYNKRADTLSASHPLGIQVNLDTGVANGVLVARDVQICAELLRRVLTNQMEFVVRDDEKTECWHLVEKLTGSIYRVVTKNRKLTNCFWNYYRTDEGRLHHGGHEWEEIA